MTDPATLAWRSPLRGAVPAGARWGALDDAAIVDRVAEGETIGRLAIADLSPLPRLGFKGRGTLAAMPARGVAVAPEPNRAVRQDDGGLCLVLGPGEVTLLAPLEGGGRRLADMEAAWRIEDGENTYPVPRRASHAWLAVAGPAAADMFAKLCGVDLRPHKFADLSIAQTSVARLNAVVVRADRGSLLTFHLLADSASAVYLLGCLLDAAGEYGGRLVGRETLAQQDVVTTGDDASAAGGRSP